MDQQVDHEKLDVYKLELQLVAWATNLIIELGDSPEAKKRRIAEAVDHLDRASLSSLFNAFEGNGKLQMKTRAKFFDDSRGFGHGMCFLSLRAGRQVRLFRSANRKG